MSNGVIITIVICATILIEELIRTVCKTIIAVNAMKYAEEENEDEKTD